MPAIPLRLPLLHLVTLAGLGAQWSSKMDELSLEDLARQLSDLELALFLSLVAREHCLIETTGNSVNDVASDLALVGKTITV